MAIVYLIRHGQASFAKEHYDELSELGQRQSARLGQVLHQRMPLFDTVCLGTMERHKQSAENCLAAFGTCLNDVKAVYDEGWNEYNHLEILTKHRPEFAIHDGLYEFLKESDNPKRKLELELNQAIDRWVHSKDLSEYSESWVAFTARVHAALEDVLAKTPHPKNVAVFTSGGPISLISQSLLGVEPERIMKMNATLLNCGITKIVSTNSRVFVASLNDHSHFEGEEYKHFITYI